jgi:hypothetical protein
MFFILSRFLTPGEYAPVYKSEVSATLKWAETRILSAILCKEEPDREIKASFYA